MTADALSGGFADPVFQSQATFRALLRALSRPGTIATLACDVTAPPPLNPAAGALLCALADDETPVYVDCAPTQFDLVSGWIGFHTGAKLVASPDDAAFAVIANATAMPALSQFRQGTDEYPDRSATLIVQVDGFAGADEVTLEGPGIADTACLAPQPMPDGLIGQLAANRRLFPRGVDIVLAAPRAIAGLPRTTRVVGSGDSGCM